MPANESRQTTPKVTTSDGFPLMELPYDVRHNIIEHMIDEQTIRPFMIPYATPIGLPNAARAGDRLLRRECILITLKLTTLEVQTGARNLILQRWLASISFEGVETSYKTAFDAIRSLKFTCFSFFPIAQVKYDDIVLCQKSKHLRKLTINFHPDALIVSHLGPVLNYAPAFRQDSHLAGLLELSNLEELRIETSGPEARMREIRELAAWFEEEFEKRARKVSVTVHRR